VSEADRAAAPSPEHDPDPRVLEELLRAFEVAEADAADRDRTDRHADASVDDLLADAQVVEGSAAEPPPAGEPQDQPHEPARDPAREEPRAAATVITITDDDLPDAVYLSGDPIARVAADLADRTPPGADDVDDHATTVGRVRPAVSVVPKQGGEAAPSDDRAVVFIDDDDTGDTVSGVRGRDPSPPARSGIEPRLRDRRVAVRRAAGRRRLRWFVVGGVVLALAVAALALLGSPLFAVEADQVRVTGNVYTDPVRLERVIDDLVGTPTLTVDTQAAEEALEAIAWVDEARVRTNFPRGASIEIRERRPLATYQGPDGQFRVIDRDGRVLDVLRGQPIAYMLITGPDPVNLAEGEFAPVGYAAAAELVRGLTPGVRARVASVDVTADASNLRLLLVDGPEVRFGAANDLLTKLVRLETVLPTVADQPITSIDVSTPEVTLR
jgi:cell division protein FtsQ